MTFSELKNLFFVDHNSALTKFYNDNRTGFLLWARKRFSLDEDTLLDVYQDSIIVLYNMVIEDKIPDNSINPTSYLYGIAKNLSLKKLKYVNHDSIDVMYDVKSEITDGFMKSFVDQSHTQEILSKAIGQLKGNCKKILELYYYRKYKLDAICTTLGLSNTDVVKSRKYQCLKELKKIIGPKSNIL